MENQENSQQALKAKEISRKDPMVIFASFFYVGFIKKAPGTFGSLAALPFLILYQLSGAPKAFIIPLLIITTVLSIYICQKIQDVYQILDPKWVVVDELLGMLVGFLFIGDRIFEAFLLFAVFRFFDIAKPWPISYVDKHMKTGLGVVIDDLIAGLLAGLTLFLVLKFI